MSPFESMSNISSLVAQRESLNRQIESACGQLVCSVVAELAPGSAADIVLLEWDREGSLVMFKAYDADYEEVRLFPSREFAATFCSNNSMYLAPLYRDGYLVSVELRDGSVEFISYGVA